MKKVVRLSEQDLVRLVKRVIQEDGAFSFGDKVRNKLGTIVGTPSYTEDEARLADDIMDCVQKGEFEFVKSWDGFRGKGYSINVELHGEEYWVRPQKELIGTEGPRVYKTYVTTPSGEIFPIQASGFTKKLMELLKNHPDDKSIFRYPKK